MKRKRCCIGFPRLNVHQLDLPLHTPRQEVSARQLRPVVAANRQRLSAFGHDLLQHARHSPALTLLGTVIMNILLYHLLLDHTGAPLAIIVAIFWGVLFFRHRQYFSGLFVQRTS